MPLVLKDRVKETTTTTSTGAYTLAGAVTGYQSFSVIGDGNTTYYAVTNGTDWEVGIGTYTSSGTTLSRDTILESSNSGNAVNWGANTKDIFCTYPAERSVYLNGAGSAVEAIGFSGALNGTVGATTPNAGTFTTLTANTVSEFGRSSANYWQAIGAATTRTPEFATLGSDTNIPATFRSKGTGAINLAGGSGGVNISNGGTVTAITRTAAGSGYISAPDVTISPPTTAGGVQATATVAISGGSITTFTITNAGSGYVEQPTVTFSGGGGSGAAAYATVGAQNTIRSLFGTLSFNTPAGESFRIFNSSAFNTTTDFIEVRGGSSVSGAYIGIGGSTTNANLYASSKGTGNVSFFTNNWSQEQFRVAHTASAVNYVQVTGAATGSVPVISSQGSDTNIALFLSSKGTGAIRFATNFTAATQVRILHTANAVNFIDMTGGAAGSPVTLSASVSSSDNNIDLALTPKGTGRVTTAAAIVATGGISGGTF